VTQTGFDDKYGDGALARLARMLGQPCVTFAQIAGEFGVSRERVRQWHRQMLPDAPTGHERQRLCAVHQQRRRLFEDSLFRAFFRHARAHFERGRIEPIRSRSGYRTRLVRIDDAIVALRDAADEEGLPKAFRYRGAAQFLFIRLREDEFIFIPALLAPTGDDVSGAPFRNSFAAFVERTTVSTGEDTGELGEVSRIPEDFRAGRPVRHNSIDSLD